MQGLPHTPPPQAPADRGAHGRFSKAPINLKVPPDLALTVALVDAGGGGAGFDADRLIADLTGGSPASAAEAAALTKRFGAARVATFKTTADFVTADALRQLRKAGYSLPTTPAAGSDPKTVASELYAAGLTPAGRYDVEYMLDSLLSHVVHVAVMDDIDAQPQLGPKADADYHAVLGQIVADLGKTAGP